jgi:uncharacterized repeat protein (TIGR01451 family)
MWMQGILRIMRVPQEHHLQVHPLLRSTLTIPAIVSPSITLNKSSSPTSFSAPGVVITYSYLVSNSGNMTLTNIAVTDPHSGLSSINCPTTTLAPGASETCTATYTTTQADVNAGLITNTGTASGTPPTGPAVSDDSTLTVPAVVSASIALFKSSSPTSFSSAGQLINYSYLVTNTGNVTLTSVAVTDPHSGLSAISCSTATLAPGASETCTATYTTVQADVNAGSITNTGTASGSPPIGPAVTADSSVTIPAVVITELTLAKSASSNSFTNAGELITYSYLITNNSNVTLTNIAVNDPHTGLSAISCPSSSLAPNASETCTATYTTTQADVDAGRITNTATASGTPPVGPVIVSAPSTVIIRGTAVPEITLAKSSVPSSFANSGILITYSYLVTNTSHVTLTNVAVTDPHTGLSAISCPTTTLAPGASETCTATYTTTQADVNAGSITNTGTATGTPPLGPAITSDSTLTVPAIVSPSIHLIKTSSPTSFSNPGVLITYSYLVQNSGNVPLTNVSVTDPHSGLSSISCPTTTLAPGASETCTATYTTTQADMDAGSIQNTGTASGTPPSGSPVTDDSTLTVPANFDPGITLDKSVSPTSFSAVGQLITYSYVVTNISNVTLSNVSVTDPHVGLSAISCPTTTLAPNVSETCTATYTTTQADVDAGSITNFATATGQPPLGPIAVSIPTLLTLPFSLPIASLTIVKVAVGGNDTFHFNSTINGSFVLTTASGSAQMSFNNLTPGNYSISEVNLPFGWQLTNLQCNGTKISGSTATISINPGDNVTCTFTNTFDRELIIQKTQEKIRTFLNSRATLILTNEPDRRRIIERLSGKSGHPLSAIDFTPAISDGHAAFTVSTNRGQLLNDDSGSQLDIWSEVHAAYFSEHLDFGKNQMGQFGLLYLGSDYLFMPSILGGLLLELDTIYQYANFDNGVSGNGQGWMFGPYLSVRLLSNIFLHTRAAWGGSSNSINPFGLYEDQFNTNRSLYNAELTGDWLRNGLRVSPRFGVSSYIENQQQYANALNIVIPSQTISLGQLNLGTEFGYEFVTSRGYIIAPRLILQSLYYFNQSNNVGFSPNKWGGQIEVGAEIKWLSMGIRLYPLLGYNGIGSNLQYLQGQVQIDLIR